MGSLTEAMTLEEIFVGWGAARTQKSLTSPMPKPDLDAKRALSLRSANGALDDAPLVVPASDGRWYIVATVGSKVQLLYSFPSAASALQYLASNLVLVDQQPCIDLRPVNPDYHLEALDGRRELPTD